mmetsp:Transcript_2091/g.3222  ORF Transcript_2091/g.3222 Transcript_2091/m.3222 type:complete len:939 (+) Transcript_2091:71-2887(+)
MLRVSGAAPRAPGKRTSASKGVCGKAKEKASVAEPPRDATLEDDASDSYWHALAAPPEKRLDAQLWEILRWWQKYIPLVGAEIAPELQVPDEVLLEVLRRSRLVTFERGNKLQEEGDELRHYAFIVSGRCKLRCSKSGGPTKSRSTIAFLENTSYANLESHNDSCDDEHAEGFIHIGEIRAGEPLGTYPGDKNVGFEVVCAEKAIALLLGKEEYEHTLKPFHKDMHSHALEFLRRHRLCTEALANNLERLVRHFRQRKITKGTTIIRAGDAHRHVWFLRDGCCRVLMSPESAAEVLQQPSKDAAPEVVEEEEDCKDDEAEDFRFAQLKASAALGAEGQQRTAADDKRNRSIAKYARGSLRYTLEGALFRSGSSGGLEVPASSARSFAATVKDSGTMLGAEALLYEQQDQLTAKCSYTIEALQDSSFYEADITMWKQLALCIKRETLTHIVNEQLQRRAQMISRSKKAVERLDKRKRELKKYEVIKSERQQLRLPWNSDSFGAKDLEDIDDYLEVVFEHRRAPRDDVNKPTLSVLEGIKLAPSGGPAVSRLLKEVSENRVEKISKKGCVSLRRTRKGSAGHRVSSGLPGNPMGESITAVQQEKYAMGLPLNFFKSIKSEASLTMPSELTRVSSQPSGVSIFHQTELDVEVTLLQSSSVPMLPRVPGGSVVDACANEDVATVTSTSVGGLDSEDTIVRPESQVSSLFSSLGPTRPSTSGNACVGTCDAELPLLDTSTSIGFELEFAHEGHIEGALPCDAEMKPKKRVMSAKIVKAFNRAVAGRSVLVLTDKPDVRKVILRSLLSTELQICFAKTQADVWHRLENQKDAFHALIWDLTKSNVSVITLLTSIRQHERYGRLPIVVLSGDQRLPDMVRKSCNYVIFHPISTPILREGLLWCFDRKAVSGFVKQDASLSQSASEAVTGGLQSWAESHPPILGWL